MCHKRKQKSTKVHNRRKKELWQWRRRRWQRCRQTIAQQVNKPLYEPHYMHESFVKTMFSHAHKVWKWELLSLATDEIRALSFNNVKFAWLKCGMVFSSQEVYVAQLNPLPKNKLRKRNSSLTQEWPKNGKFATFITHWLSKGKTPTTRSEYSARMRGCVKLILWHKALASMQHCWRRFVQFQLKWLTPN